MGLFSGVLGAVGSMFGPVGTAVGGALGGLVDGNKEKKQAASARQDAVAAYDTSAYATGEWRRQDRAAQIEDANSDRAFAYDVLNKQQAFEAAQIDAQNKYNSPEELRKRAEAAGFNPLALLGTGVGMQSGIASSGSAPYGGSGGGGIPTTIAPSADLSALPVPSSDLSLIGEAFGAGMQEYSSAVSETTGLREHNNALKRELARITVRPAVGGVYGGGDIPVQMVAGGKYGPTSKPSKPPAVDKDAEAASEKGYATGSKSGTLFGMELETSGLFSDGAWFTDKYGEPAEWAVAIPSMAADVGYTIGKNARRGVDSWIKSKKDAYSAIDWKKYGEEADQLYKRKPSTEFDHYKKMRLKYAR